jgi:2-dehydropantoate 2-reductase
MRVAMMGSGGIGGYVGARLAEVGEDVHFVARGNHLAAMREGGLRVESPFGNVHLPRVSATEEPNEIGPVDLVIFAVKLWDTDSAAARLGALVGPDTRVLTLQNGVDSRTLLRRHVPDEQIVEGIIYVPAVIAAPGVIRNPGGPRQMVADERGRDAVIAALVDAGLRANGLDIEATEDIGSAVWGKFIRNAAFSAATSVTRLPAGAVLGHPESRSLLRALVQEGVLIAAAEGHAMASDFLDKTMILYESLAPQTRSSMAEDLEQGRRLEVEFISGRMHSLGLAHGIPTPAHTMAFRALAVHAHGATS